MPYNSVIPAAERLAEIKIRKAVNSALPGIEAELKAYLSETAEESGLDIIAEIAALEMSDVLGTLLDSVSVEQVSGGINVTVDTQAAIEILESIAVILTKEAVVDMDSIMDEFRNTIDIDKITGIVTDNIKAAL